MKSSQRIQQRGTVLVAVLVCMVVATTILLGAVKFSLAQRRQVREEYKMEQAQWLLDAAINRGLSLIQKNSEYRGDAISLAPALTKYSIATIETNVERSPADNEIKLRVIVRLGNERQPEKILKRSRELTYKN